MLDKVLIYGLSKKYGLTQELILEYLREFSFDSLHMIKFPKSYNIYFMWDFIFSMPDKMLNAFILRKHDHESTFPVCMNRLWAQEIIRNYYDQNILASARISIGHEFAHITKRPRNLGHDKSLDTFLMWCDEIQADFNGAKFFDFGREELIQSCKHKQQYKLTYIGKDKSSPSHPSWTKRLHYAANFNFDDDLIRQIAKDTGTCISNKMIDQILNHYGICKFPSPFK